MALTLTVHHTIHLSKDERYALHEGKDVEVVGASLPVWFSDGWTSEPGKEVFCKYTLKNTRKEIPIKTTSSGYEIELPCKEIKPPKQEVSNQEYWKLSDEEKEEYYKQRGPQASSLNLLDIKDGGSKCLVYREHNKIKYGGKMHNIVHFVNLEDMGRLLESIEDPTLTADNLLNS